MTIILYYLPPSPAVRAVLLAGKALNIEFDLKLTDLNKEEHMTAEYLKINPMHTVPTLDDDGFILFDSHAINAYLVGKYAKDDSLYPKDLQKRAIVDQRLYFDASVLFARLKDMVYPVFCKEVATISDDKKKGVREAYGFLDKLIGDNDWVAGNRITIADFSCVATFSSLQFMVSGWEVHPNVVAWYERCKTHIQGYQDANQHGVDLLEGVFKSFIPS